MANVTLGHALRHHYPAFLIEALGLGVFLTAAGTYATVLNHPALPIAGMLDPAWRRVVMACAMSLTLLSIVYWPLMRTSGAHINPAVTIALLRLRKVSPWDAVLYIAGQFVGAFAAVGLLHLVAVQLLGAPETWFVPTMPGEFGPIVAAVVEFFMAGGLMALALSLAEFPRMKPYTGFFAAGAILLYALTLAPISGLGINPARSTASAIPAGTWDVLWVYYVGPITGMLTAAEVRRRFFGTADTPCCGINHLAADQPVFVCGEGHWKGKHLCTESVSSSESTRGLGNATDVGVDSADLGTSGGTDVAGIRGTPRRGYAMDLAKRCGAEFLGTFWLVFGGCGSAVLAAAFPEVGIGLVGVSFAFGLTVLTMAYAIGHISGCHLNPAVTIGLVAGNRFSPRDAAPYIAAQVLGGIAAAAVLYVIASGKAGFTVADGFAANGFGELSPGGYTFRAAFVAEWVLTFFFLLIIHGATDRRAPQGFAPLAIGLALTLIHLIGIPVTNLSVNPARSTGPAVFVGGWALAQLWVFWVAPILGAAIAGLLYRIVFEEPESPEGEGA